MDLPLLDKRLERIEDEMRSIAQALNHLTRVDERLKQHRDSIDDHEERLRVLEQSGNTTKGTVQAAERVVWLLVTIGLALLQFIH